MAKTDTLHLHLQNDSLELEHSENCWCCCSHTEKPIFDGETVYYWLKL